MWATSRCSLVIAWFNWLWAFSWACGVIFSRLFRKTNLAKWERKKESDKESEVERKKERKWSRKKERKKEINNLNLSKKKRKVSADSWWLYQLSIVVVEIVIAGFLLFNRFTFIFKTYSNLTKTLKPQKPQIWHFHFKAFAGMHERGREHGRVFRARLLRQSSAQTLESSRKSKFIFRC